MSPTSKTGSILSTITKSVRLGTTGATFESREYIAYDNLHRFEAGLDPQSFRIRDLTAANDTFRRVFLCSYCSGDDTRGRKNAQRTLAKAPFCPHVSQMMNQGDDTILLSAEGDNEGMDRWTAFGVPLHSHSPFLVTLYARPLSPYYENAEYNGYVVIGYPTVQNTPATQAHNLHSVIELDVLPYDLLHRDVLNATFLDYLLTTGLASWPGISTKRPVMNPTGCGAVGHGLRAEADPHTTMGAVITKLRGHYRMNEPFTLEVLSDSFTQVEQLCLLGNLMSKEQYGMCLNCASFDPSDDVPEV